jgi:TM2 domain-containing membrane protein YozV
MKSTIISYILGGIGLVSPLAGLHRFYLDKPVSGVFYVLTWGFFGIGTIIDLVRMPTLVDEANRKQLNAGPGTFYMLDGKSPWSVTTPEREILKVCKKNQGVVTVQMIALETSLSLSDAKRELAKLQSEGYCTLDIDEDGVEIYRFNGLVAKQPLLA